MNIQKLTEISFLNKDIVISKRIKNVAKMFIAFLERFFYCFIFLAMEAYHVDTSPHVVLAKLYTTCLLIKITYPTANRISHELNYKNVRHETLLLPLSSLFLSPSLLLSFNVGKFF